MTVKGHFVEGHRERVELYAERYSQGQDIFTGRPLSDNELSEEEAVRVRKLAWEKSKGN
tara:strand:+ start:187 stop:363 length:177 start_codon:yes stop_codon:yes gene_type:complete